MKKIMHVIIRMQTFKIWVKSMRMERPGVAKAYLPFPLF